MEPLSILIGLAGLMATIYYGRKTLDQRDPPAT